MYGFKRISGVFWSIIFLYELSTVMVKQSGQITVFSSVLDFYIK